ncbi:MAG: aminotransferase class I/II-fold pyridoxal phosphate-dependent enzyme [Armatimonadetes bacterium]|nr:aminotransferase class I/II-fold pyridoxal phosphate-dependent enzyme [Candidatus Hippobium faecium]
MKPINKFIENMPPSGIRKFFDIVATMDDVISLGVGEPDFVTPWPMISAAIDSMEMGKTSYTSNMGLLALRQEISRYIQKNIGVEYNPDNQILITVGVSEAVDLLMRTIITPGDEIIVFEPSYVSYIPTIEMAGGKSVVLDCREENDFLPDIDEFEKKITPKTKAVLFNFPSNPTGCVLNRDINQKLYDICNKYDLYIISDEIYDRLTYDKKHESILEIPGAYDRTILLNGFSKAFAMTGWRVGYACGNKDIIRNMMKIHQYTMLCAPISGQYCALEALKNCISLSDDMVEEYRQRRNLIVKGFNDMGLECKKPGGAFYVFPSVKKFGMTSEEFCEKLLYGKKVATVPGNAFGACGEGYIRCSYATGKKKIVKALEQIQKFIDEL